jgi:hypothetical protein
MAFSAWYEAAQERSLLQQMYKWVVVHWERRELRWAFNVWLYTVRHTRKYSSETRALLHWLQLEKAAGFQTWLDLVVQRNMAKVLARKALLAWTHQWLRSGLNSWNVFMDQMRYQQELLYKAACCWSRIGAVRALHTWQWRLMQAQTAHELIYKAMFRWAHRSMAFAFDAWRVNINNAEESILIAEQHHKFSNLSISLVYLRMHREACQNRGARDKDAEKADQHLRLSYLRYGFDMWGHFKQSNKSATPPPESLAVPSSGRTSRMANAVPPYGLFSVIVTHTAPGRQDRALYYVIEVTLEGRTHYVLNKRYRDFDVLNSILMDRFAMVLDKVSQKGGTVPTLPPKKSFTKLNPEFYETRCQELHQYLQDLIAIPQIAASEELCEFLQFAAKMF